MGPEKEGPLMLAALAGCFCAFGIFLGIEQRRINRAMSWVAFGCSFANAVILVVEIGILCGWWGGFWK